MKVSWPSSQMSPRHGCLWLHEGEGPCGGSANWCKEQVSLQGKHLAAPGLFPVLPPVPNGGQIQAGAALCRLGGSVVNSWCESFKHYYPKQCCRRTLAGMEADASCLLKARTPQRSPSAQMVTQRLMLSQFSLYGWVLQSVVLAEDEQVAKEGTLTQVQHSTERAVIELCFPCSTGQHLELQGQDWTYPAPRGLIADGTERGLVVPLQSSSSFLTWVPAMLHSMLYELRHQK